MQSAILAVTLCLSAMGCHHGSVCVSGDHGGWHRHMGGYSQGWPSPAYAPVTYSDAGYSAASGQMASYAPMSAGYAMPVASYPLYTSATPMTYGTPGTMT